MPQKSVKRKGSFLSWKKQGRYKCPKTEWVGKHPDDMETDSDETMSTISISFQDEMRKDSYIEHDSDHDICTVMCALDGSQAVCPPGD